MLNLLGDSKTLLRYVGFGGWSDFWITWCAYRKTYCALLYIAVGVYICSLLAYALYT